MSQPIPEDSGAAPVGETLIGPYPAAGPADTRPESIDRFKIVRQIGRGGMGNVYLARHPMTGADVAIKCLKPQLLVNPRVVRAFLAEARHMYHLNHPRILRIMEVGDGIGGPFYVMLYMPAGSLAAQLQRGKPADAALTLRVACDLAEALAHAHQKGIIHRDLKPANVLMESDGRACLCDFGMVHDFGSNELTTEADGTAYREGTVGYMSPAIARGEAEDTRCDIYSFGALLCELLTGSVPYDAPTVQLTLERIVAGGPVKILERNPRAHPGLAAIAEGCLARELRDRYALMSDVVADLNRVAAGKHPRGPHGTWRRRPRRAARIAAIAVALVAIALAVTLALHNRNGAGSPNAGPAMAASPSLSPGSPGEPARVVELLPLIDPEMDATAGTAKRGPAGIEWASTARDERASLVFPYEPPKAGGEYDLKVVFSRIGGDDGLDHCIVRGDRAFFWTLGGFGNSMSSFWWVGSGGFGDGNPTAVKRPQWMTTGERHTSEIRCRDGFVEAWFDGRQVSHYPTDYADLHFPKSDEVPDAWGRRLGLSILRGQFVIHQVQLTERSGQGIVYRHAPRDPRLLWAARAGLARPYAVHFLAGGAGQAVLAASSSPQQNRNTFTAWSETGQRITRLDGWWAVPAPKGQIVHVSGGGRLNLTYPLEPAATDSKELGLASSAVIGSFLPDGSRIAVVGKSDQSAVQVLENESGAELARLTLPGVSWIGFSPDGRYLAAMGNHLGQRVIALWNADVAGETNEPLWRVEVPARSRSEPSHEASQPLVGGFSSSGRWLLARSGNTVLLFPTDAAQHRKSATPTSQSADRRELVLSQEVTGARFTRDDRYLVISCADPAKGLQLWDVETATEIQRFKSPQGPVRAMEVTTDGTRVAAGSDDGFVRLFALDSGQELTRFTGHDAPVTGLAISADDKTIVSGSEDGLIRVFSLAK